LRNVIGTMAKTAALGIIVVGAKKLWDLQRLRPMSEPLSGSRYNATTASFGGARSADMETDAIEPRPVIESETPRPSL